MAGSGLLALLDDVASIADDVATLSTAATKKAAGVVTDDMAVTAEQTLGLAREREIPVVLQVARGSLFNKTVLLAPAALLLSAVAPWAIHPILMAGGLFLSFEGVEKLIHALRPHHGTHEAHEAPAGVSRGTVDLLALERERVRGAVRTDLILSGEIVAITLGEVTDHPFLTQAAVLYGVSVVITVAVYGLVAALIKLDDVGLWLRERGGPQAALGEALVRGTPWLMHAISWIGMVAMLAVGGHILAEGIPPIARFEHDRVAHLSPVAGWFAGTGVAVATGAVAGALVVAVMATGLPQRLWAAFRRPAAG